MKYTLRSLGIAAFIIVGAVVIGASFAGGLKEQVEPELEANQKGSSVLTCSDSSAINGEYVQLGGNNSSCN